MTYGVQRMTFTGNTLCDKLKAEFGERTAVSLELGREANARRAERATKARNASSVASENRDAMNRSRSHMSNVREFEGSKAARGQRSVNAQSRPVAQRRPNIMRDTVVHKMERPHTDKTPLEISVATFATAYRRGERVREYVAAERRKPHARRPASSKAEKKSTVVALVNKLRAFVFGEKRRAEVKVKRSPFPIGMIALIAVCTVMVMVMMNSFTQLYEYRSSISKLESQQASLRAEQTKLVGLVEAKEDIRAIEKMATEELGMVSSDLVKSEFVSLSSEDRVEMKNTSSQSESGAFSTLLSAIGENLGSVSEYFN